MAQLLTSVDPSSIAFSLPKRHGPIYLMQPVQPLAMQTPVLTCAASVGPADTKIHVLLDSTTEGWIRAFEDSFKTYAKANTSALFNKELDPGFIDESFRSSLPVPGAHAPVALTLSKDAAVFLHTHELATRDLLVQGTPINLMLEVSCIQFGKKWFTPKLRVLSVRIPPPPPPPKATPTYESFGWLDVEDNTEGAGLPSDDDEDDDLDALSIDIDPLPIESHPQPLQPETILDDDPLPADQAAE